MENFIIEEYDFLYQSKIGKIFLRFLKDNGNKFYIYPSTREEIENYIRQVYKLYK